MTTLSRTLIGKIIASTWLISSFRSARGDGTLNKFPEPLGWFAPMPMQWRWVTLPTLVLWGFYSQHSQWCTYWNIMYEAQDVAILILFKKNLFSRNHSCQENARCVIREDFKMDVYSIADIAKGEEITISYLPSLFFTLPERRQKLEQTWYFQCKCCR